MNNDDLPVDAEQQRQEIAEAFKQFLSKLNNQICPHCDTPIMSRRKVGRCMYAEPCGHRLYQVDEGD